MQNKSKNDRLSIRHLTEKTLTKAATKEAATKEAATKEVAKKEAATKEAATKEAATKEVATKEAATKEVATKEAATKKVATKEAATKEAATKEAATKEVATKEIATKTTTTKAVHVGARSSVVVLISNGAPFTQPDRNTTMDVDFVNVPKNATLRFCNESRRMLVIVICEPGDFSQRTLIRETWAANLSVEISLLFHFGRSKMENQRNSIARNLTKEIEMHDDLLISNVIENYYNLTRKTYGVLRFLQDVCPDMPCVVKSDIDTVLNLDALLRLCKESQPETIRGACFHSSLVPFRNNDSKYFVPEWVYPSKYPEFCSGSAYMLVGVGIASKLLSNFEKTKFSYSENYKMLGEDIFLATLAANSNVTRVHTTGFSPGSSVDYHCFANGDKEAFSVHYMRSTIKIIRTWNLMKNKAKC